MGEKRDDIFLDVFADDYIKIIKAIERKKEARGVNYDHNDIANGKKSKITHLNNSMGKGDKAMLKKK